MNWYWIVLAVVGYTIGGVVVSIIFYKGSKDVIKDDYLNIDLATLIAAIWPVYLPVALLFAFMHKILEKIDHKED